MNAVGHMGITSTSHRLEHLAILLRPPREPSRLESLPTEIIVQIAQIAQDLHVKENTPIHPNGATCLCHGKTSGTKGHVGVAKDVMALGGASRRLRAVLVHAGFFRSISIQGNADQLFAASIGATDGFFDKAEAVILRLAYRGLREAPLDTANMRRTLDLYTGAKHMYIRWNTSLAYSPLKSLPPLPPTRSTPPAAPKQSNLQSLILSVTDCALNDPPTPSPAAQADTRQIISSHLCQLVSIVVTPSVKELDLMISFFDTGFSVRDGLSVFVDALEGIKHPGLTRLGITGFYNVNTRKEVSQKWLSTLEKLLMLAPQISSTITDIEIVITVRMNSSRVFTRAPTTDTASLPGLIPLRDQVIEMFQRLANANVEIRPFSIGITSETALLPLRTPLLLLEYIPAAYNNPQAAMLLPERMHVGVETEQATRLIGAPETRHVLGGDDMRYAVNRLGVEDTYVDVLGMEQMRGFMMPLAQGQGAM